MHQGREEMVVVSRLRSRTNCVAANYDRATDSASVVRKGSRSESGSSAAGDAGAPSGPGGELRCQSPAHARISRMDRGASVPVCAASRPSTGLARGSGSDRAANHAVRRVPRSLRFPTQHLPSGRSLLLIMVWGMETSAWIPNPKNWPCFATG